MANVYCRANASRSNLTSTSAGSDLSVCGGSGARGCACALRVAADSDTFSLAASAAAAAGFGLPPLRLSDWAARVSASAQTSASDSRAWATAPASHGVGVTKASCPKSKPQSANGACSSVSVGAARP
eukprot:6209632-Pleurochrysis_carterae.AAC.2